MGFKNLADNTSTTVTTATPGCVLDLTYHTTIRLAALGVPVRLKVYVTATAGDTAAVKLLDSDGIAVITVLCNAGTGWYWGNGYVPALSAKYDLHYGGNTLGTLGVTAANLYSLDWSTDIISGTLSSTFGALTLVATGTNTTNGVLDSTFGAVTLVATGTVVSSEVLPTYVGSGAVVSGAGALAVTTATHQADDILIVQVNNTNTTTTAATLSTANGFAQITGAAIDSGSYAGIHAYSTLFWKRASDSAATLPTVADNGEGNVCQLHVFRGCYTGGDPWDVVTCTGDTDADATMTATGHTTTSTNRLVGIFVGAFTGGSGPAAIASWTNTDLANVTERADTSTDIATNDVHIAMATGEKAATGAFGNSTATWSGYTGYVVTSAIVVSFKPA